MEHLLSGFLGHTYTTPGKLAVVEGDRSYTYSELNDKSNELAYLLTSLGVCPDETVGICLPRGFGFMASAMAVLKVGGSYLPLDTNYPEDRLEFMAKKAGIKICIGASYGGATIAPYKDGVNEAEEFPVICGERVYTIFTSGSTGSPKGVDMARKSSSNLLAYEASAPSICMHYAPVSFDVHFQEIFGTLNNGGKIVVVSEQGRKDFKALCELLVKEKAQKLYLPYVALSALATTAAGMKFPELKKVLVTGEQLRINGPIRKFFKNNPACSLINQFGPSETHFHFEKALTGDPDSWEDLASIGGPISGVTYRVLNERGEDSRRGELYVGGACLSHGYVNDPERTEAAFVQLNGERFYRTGDIVSLEKNGEFYFRGRADDQVKVRGFRVELGEVENYLERASGLRAACRVVEIKGQNHLCGYLLGNFEEINIKKKLKSIAPEYYLPRFIKKIDEFPYTPSGKLDRKNLPNPDLTRPELETPYKAPACENEKWLRDLWEEVLLIDGIGTNDKFYHLGGDSLSAIELSTKIRQVRPELSLAMLYEKDTISGQAKLLGPETKNYSHKYKQVNQKKDVAIIAMTGRFPGANSVEELWELMKSGKNAIASFPSEQAHKSVENIKDPNFRPFHGEWKDSVFFDHEFFGVTPREAEIMDPQQRKFLELSQEVLEFAQIDPETTPYSIGVYAAESENTYQKNFSFHHEKLKNFGDFNTMIANDKDFLATRVAFKLGLKGPALNINTGCSSALVCVATAVDAIRHGHCEVALAGAITVFGQKKKGYIYQEDNIFSEDGACRPYSSAASGTVFTEGAGVFVLKDKDLADKDGDKILAVIKGIGLNNDGAAKVSFTAPSVSGQVEAIERAFDDAGISADNICFIEGHGTGTKIGDPIECEALNQAFINRGRSKSNKVLLGSIKSNIGHLVAAAGAAGLVKSVLSLNKGEYPGTCGLEDTSQYFDFKNSPLMPTETSTALGEGPLYASISSLGVGGTNAHLILEGPCHRDSQEKRNNNSGADEMYFVSAKSPEALSENQKYIDNMISKHDNIAATLAHKRTYSYRSFRRSGREWSPAKKAQNFNQLVGVFPGQATQYAGMALKLEKRFPAFKAPFQKCERYLQKRYNYSLREALMKQEVLDKTSNAQPCIFVYQYCMGKLMESFGVSPDIYIGHSIGEYAVCCLNSVFSLESALDMVFMRGKLMDELPRGEMAMIFASCKEVEPLLQKDAQIAAFNGPRATVISGSFEAIEATTCLLGDWPFNRLKTSHAFHGNMMAPMLEEFSAICKGVEFNIPRGKIISTMTGSFEDRAFASSQYWVDHIIRPVQFEEAIKKTLSVDNLFLEYGPKNGLEYLIKESFFSKEAATIGLGKSKDEVCGVLDGLARLWTYGADAIAPQLYPKPKRPAIISYQFAKHKHWLDFKESPTTENVPREQTELCRPLHGRASLVKTIEDISGLKVSEKEYDKSFLDLGMDSLFMTQMSSRLLKDFGLQVSSRSLRKELDTIHKLLNLIEKKGGEELEAQVFLSDLASARPKIGPPKDPSTPGRIGKDERGNPIWLY